MGDVIETSGRRVRIVGVSCSPRKGKTTAEALRICLEASRAVSPRVETELIDLGGRVIDGNLAAGLPPEPGRPDDFPAIAERLADPAVGGIILGVPVYMGGPPALGKAFLDRWTIFRKNNFALRDKVGACLSVGGSRNGGQELAIVSVLVAMLYQEMVIVGDAAPGSHFGASVLNDGKDDVSKDETGLAMARGLGRRVAEVALRLAR